MGRDKAILAEPTSKTVAERFCISGLNLAFFNLPTNLVCIEFEVFEEFCVCENCGEKIYKIEYD